MLFLVFQNEAKGTLNGEKVEHQRTTFVKQLKLGKVSPHHTPYLLCFGGLSAAAPDTQHFRSPPSPTRSSPSACASTCSG